MLLKHYCTVPVLYFKLSVVPVLVYVEVVTWDAIILILIRCYVSRSMFKVQGMMK